MIDEIGGSEGSGQVRTKLHPGDLQDSCQEQHSGWVKSLVLQWMVLWNAQRQFEDLSPVNVRSVKSIMCLPSSAAPYPSA